MGGSGEGTRQCFRKVGGSHLLSFHIPFLNPAVHDTQITGVRNRIPGVLSYQGRVGGNSGNEVHLGSRIICTLGIIRGVVQMGYLIGN